MHILSIITKIIIINYNIQMEKNSIKTIMKKKNIVCRIIFFLSNSLVAQNSTKWISEMIGIQILISYTYSTNPTN
jgi:hypothetical protein